MAETYDTAALPDRMTQFVPHAAALGMELVSIDYLRPARPRSGVTAEATCYRLTRSIGFVRAQAWDDDPADPLATAQATFMLNPRG